MGLFGKKCQTAGYAYFAEFAYVYAEDFTSIERISTSTRNLYISDNNMTVFLHPSTGEYEISDVKVSVSGSTEINVISDSAYNAGYRIVKWYDSTYGRIEGVDDRTVRYIPNGSATTDRFIVRIYSPDYGRTELVAILINGFGAPDRHYYLDKNDLSRRIFEIPLDVFTLEPVGITYDNIHDFRAIDDQYRYVYKDGWVTHYKDFTATYLVYTPLTPLSETTIMPIMKPSKGEKWGFNYKIQTGEQAKVNGSGTGYSYVTVFNTNNTNEVPYLGTWTGYPIRYRQTAGLVFNNVFIGDNVSTIPNYSIIANNKRYSKIIEERGSAGANPINVIYDLVINHLGYTEANIDYDSFLEAAITCEAEFIHIDLLIGKQVAVSSLIDDICNIIDGVVYIAPISGKVKISLFRGGYDVDDLYELNDSHFTDLEIQSDTWGNTPNKFIFSYTNMIKGETESKVVYNPAGVAAGGVYRTEEIDLTMLTDPFTINTVANRIVAKNGVPLSAGKFKLNVVDGALVELGDVFVLKSDLLGVNGRIFRIIEIGGDKEDATFLEIKVVEDFYNYKTQNLLPPIPPIYNDNGLVSSDKYDLHGIRPSPMLWEQAPPELYNKPAMIAGIYPSKGLFDERTNFATEAYIRDKNLGGEWQSCSVVTTVGTHKCEFPYSFEFDPEYKFRMLTQSNVEDIPYDFDNLANPRHYIVSMCTDHIPTTTHVPYEIIAIGGRKLIGQYYHETGYMYEYEMTGVIRGMFGTSICAHYSQVTDENGNAQDKPMGFNAIDNEYPLAVVEVPYLKTDTDIEYYMKNAFSSTEVRWFPMRDIPIWDIETPYRPHLFYQDGKIKWRMRAPRHGATYYSTEEIKAGYDEYYLFGYYIVTNPDGSTRRIDPQDGDTIFEHTPTGSGYYDVTHYHPDKEYLNATNTIHIE